MNIRRNMLLFRKCRINGNFRFRTSMLCITLCSILIASESKSQNENAAVNIGELPPEISVSEWLHGKPIQTLQKGKIYIVEFWATWCPPCIDAIPELSRLAAKYKKSVEIISINILQNKRYPKSRAKSIIDSLGNKVKYSVGFDDDSFMENEWFAKTWDASIPICYLINRDGKIAWIGHPSEIKPVLDQVANGKWNIDSAARQRNYQQVMFEKDKEIDSLVLRFSRNGSFSDYVGEPDSVLYYISKEVLKNPDLNYSYHSTYHRFIALLKTDMNKAYDFAIEAVRQTNSFGPQYSAIIGGIKYINQYFSLKPEMYGLGAILIEKYNAKNVSNLIRASEWYWLAGKKADAMRCSKAARKAMKKAKTNYFGTFF